LAAGILMPSKGVPNPASRAVGGIRIFRGVALAGSKLGLIRAIFAAGVTVIGIVEAAAQDEAVARLVNQEVYPRLPSDGAGGAALAVRIDGRTLFFNFGWADVAQRRPVTSDSLFNLGSIRKAFEATVLAQAFQQGELAFDDPVIRYVTELQRGNDIRRVTIGQLAVHTSGLLLPPDHPPWPTQGYTLAEFIRMLGDWKLNDGQEPGKQHIYTHAGYVLLQLALERRFDLPIAELLDRRVIRPLGLDSTTVPLRGADGRAELAPVLMSRAVQGYDGNGKSVGQPGDQQTFYDFSGTGQMFSSARDLATFLAANLGELRIDPPLQEAMQSTHRGIFRIDPRTMQGMAWEVIDHDGIVVVDKPGGIVNSSTYIGMVPGQKLGLALLINRGNQYPYEFGRKFLLELARDRRSQDLTKSAQ
jgi:beta-lactamase class C